MDKRDSKQGGLVDWTLVSIRLCVWISPPLLSSRHSSARILKTFAPSVWRIGSLGKSPNHPSQREWGLGSYFVKVKDKVPLVQALILCTGRTAHRGSRGIALPYHDRGTRRGQGVSVTPRPHFTPEKLPVPIVQEAVCVPGPVWTGAENLDPTGIRSPDRPARSQSLHRLRYPAH